MGHWLSLMDMAEFGGKGSTWNHVLPGANGSCQNGNGREMCAIGHGKREHRPNWPFSMTPWQKCWIGPKHPNLVEKVIHGT